MTQVNVRFCMEMAKSYAEKMSGCQKVKVGSAIVKENAIVSLGANRSMPDLCSSRGCLRVERYGDDGKAHRNPGDCRAIHSEIDAISHAKTDLCGATIVVTRYPCESCAKAIISAGIKSVYYGGTTKMSDETIRMFESYGVDHHFVEGYRDDSDR